MNIDEFKKELEKININITACQLNKLEQYYELLNLWNEKINLTTITNKKDVYLKHFYDSLTINTLFDLNKKIHLCDIGTGAGFPGIVLKIVFPSLKITLIDSVLKKVNFLNEVIKKLDLKDIEAIHERAEVFAKNNLEKYDVVTSRAVASLNMLLELSIPILKVKGYFIPLKGKIDQELKDSENTFLKLKSQIVSINSFLLPYENSNRTILLIQKNQKTDKKYPRKYKEIKSNPL